MQQRLQVFVIHMLVVQLDNAAVHQEQIEANLNGASQEHRHIVGVDEVKLQGRNAEGIESAVDPLVAIHHTKLRCRQTGQRTGHDIFHLGSECRLGQLGIINAGAFVIGHGTVHAALDLLRLENLLTASLKFLLEPIVHFDLVEMQGKGNILEAVFHGQNPIGIFGKVRGVHAEGAFEGHGPALAKPLIVVSALDGILAAHLIHNIEYFFSVCIHLSLRV